MIPFGSETVTLIRRSETVDENNRKHALYATRTLTGCSWRRSARVFMNGEALTHAEVVTCRIPAGQAVPVVGDLILLGELSITVASAADYQAALEAHRESGAFFVASVADNSRADFPIPHYAARG